MYDGIHHWIKHQPILEDEYPYTAKEGKCTEDTKEKTTKSPVKNIKGVSWMNPTCDDLKAALREGPQSVAVDAGRAAWRSYTGGIVRSSCRKVNLNHGVVAVGWGVENDVEYFYLKNSWGPRWGDNGYIKVSMLPDGNCGTCNEPVYLRYKD